MAAPDDLALNLEYAMVEAGAGNLLSAASTLERLLLVRPDWTAARLNYAIILYRLDDLDGARRQLGQLETAKLTDAERVQVLRYTRLAARESSSRGTIKGSVSAGVAYSSDAYGAYYSQFDFAGVPPRRDAGSWGLISGRVEGTTKLSRNGSVSAFGSLWAVNRSRMSGPQSDFQFGELRAGLSSARAGGSWRIGGVWRGYRLFGDPYSTEAGVQAEISRRFDASTSVSMSGEAVRQRFDEPQVDARRAQLGGTRDGWRYDLGLGLVHRPGSRSMVGLNAGYSLKTAEYDPFGFSGPYAQALYGQRFLRGAYFNLTGAVRWMDYDGRDPVFLANARRRETRTNVRAEFGVPLGSLTKAGVTGDARDDIDLLFALTYDGRDFAPPLADYSAIGGEAILIWRFGQPR